MFAHAATKVEKSCCSAGNADMFYIVTGIANASIGNNIKRNAGNAVMIEMFRKIL